MLNPFEKKRQQRIECQKHFFDYCKQKNYKHHLIVNRGKRKDLIAKKREVAKYLRSLGYSYPVIGLVMDKDHTSIMHMVKDEFRERRNKNNLNRHHNRRILTKKHF